MSESWYEYVLESKTYNKAARFAADNNWWLHSWQWLQSNIDGVRIYINIESTNFSGNKEET